MIASFRGVIKIQLAKKEKKMKYGILSIAVASLLVFSGVSLAAEMPAAAKSKCLTCHALDRKVVGPSFMDISKKYKGDPDAVAKLVANITKGGTFGWKITSMPPRGMGANDAQIKAMAEYIAGLAK
ncbi:MAG: c-type cytochrome [Gallionella sp.]|nr:c-type cytochrome [Gallionella sp.]